MVWATRIYSFILRIIDISQVPVEMNDFFLCWMRQDLWCFSAYRWFLMSINTKWSHLLSPLLKTCTHWSVMQGGKKWWRGQLPPSFLPPPHTHFSPLCAKLNYRTTDVWCSSNPMLKIHSRSLGLGTHCMVTRLENAPGSVCGERNSATGVSD